MTGSDEAMAMVNARQGEDRGETISRLLLPVVILCAFAIVGFDIGDGTPYPGDIEDRLRVLGCFASTTIGCSRPIAAIFDGRACARADKCRSDPVSTLPRGSVSLT